MSFNSALLLSRATGNYALIAGAFQKFSGGDQGDKCHSHTDCDSGLGCGIRWTTKQQRERYNLGCDEGRCMPRVGKFGDHCTAGSCAEGYACDNETGRCYNPQCGKCAMYRAMGMTASDTQQPRIRLKKASINAQPRSLYGVKDKDDRKAIIEGRMKAGGICDDYDSCEDSCDDSWCDDSDACDDSCDDACDDACDESFMSTYHNPRKRVRFEPTLANTLANTSLSTVSDKKTRIKILEARMGKAKAKESTKAKELVKDSQSQQDILEEIDVVMAEVAVCCANNFTIEDDLRGRIKNVVAKVKNDDNLCKVYMDSGLWERTKETVKAFLTNNSTQAALGMGAAYVLQNMMTAAMAVGTELPMLLGGEDVSECAILKKILEKKGMDTVCLDFHDACSTNDNDFPLDDAIRTYNFNKTPKTKGILKKVTQTVRNDIAKVKLVVSGSVGAQDVATNALNKITADNLDTKTEQEVRKASSKSSTGWMKWIAGAAGIAVVAGVAAAALTGGPVPTSSLVLPGSTDVVNAYGTSVNIRPSDFYVNTDGTTYTSQLYNTDFFVDKNGVAYPSWNIQPAEETDKQARLEAVKQAPLSQEVANDLAETQNALGVLNTIVPDGDVSNTKNVIAQETNTGVVNAITEGVSNLMNHGVANIKKGISGFMNHGVTRDTTAFDATLNQYLENDNAEDDDRNTEIQSIDSDNDDGNDVEVDDFVDANSVNNDNILVGSSNTPNQNNIIAVEGDNIFGDRMYDPSANARNEKLDSTEVDSRTNNAVDDYVRIGEEYDQNRPPIPGPI